MVEAVAGGAESLQRVDSIHAVMDLDWTQVHAALWERRLPVAARASFARLVAGQVFSVSGFVDPRRENPARLVDEIPEVRPWLSEVPLIGDELARAELAADVVLLCAAMGQLVKGGSLRVRIAVVDHDACAKFHVDEVALRALCTYAGAGTEYVPEAFVDRRALSLAREEAWPPRRANRAICRDPLQVVQSPPGAVFWMRGASFPEAATPPAVHRSPPTPKGEDRRLVLSVDAVN